MARLVLCRDDAATKASGQGRRNPAFFFLAQERPVCLGCAMRSSGATLSASAGMSPKLSVFTNC